MAYNPNAKKLMELEDYSELIRFVETEEPKYPTGLEESKKRVVDLGRWLEREQKIYRNRRWYKPFAAAMTHDGILCAIVKGAYYPEVYRVGLGTDGRTFILTEYYGAVRKGSNRTVAEAVHYYNQEYPQHKIITFKGAIPK